MKEDETRSNAEQAAEDERITEEEYEEYIKKLLDEYEKYKKKLLDDYDKYGGNHFVRKFDEYLARKNQWEQERKANDPKYKICTPLDQIKVWMGGAGRYARMRKLVGHTEYPSLGAAHRDDVLVSCFFLELSPREAEDLMKDAALFFDSDRSERDRFLCKCLEECKNDRTKLDPYRINEELEEMGLPRLFAEGVKKGREGKEDVIKKRIEMDPNKAEAKIEMEKELNKLGRSDKREDQEKYKKEMHRRREEILRNCRKQDHPTGAVNIILREKGYEELTEDEKKLFSPLPKKRQTTKGE